MNGKTIEGFTGERRGCDATQFFPPFGNSALLSYHSLNSPVHPYLSLNSAIIVYPMATSEFVFVIRMALKFNKSFKVINI